jgi:hypothetical protein
MTGLRLLGHVLLWGGFLSASVAMVSQRELDLLPDEERAMFLSLPADFSVPRDYATTAVGKSWSELDSPEFVQVVLGQYRWELKRREEAKGDPAPSTAPPTAPSSAPAEGHPAISKAALLAQRTDRLESLWPTVAWLAYFPAAVVGLVGVILLRATGKQNLDAQTAQTTGLDPLRTSLLQLLAEVGKLATDLPNMTPEAVVAFIDDRCSTHCNDFADQRERLKLAFGLVGFGEIMSEFASGERLLNRAWSAAADGYMEEAYRSVKTALEFFLAAQAHLVQSHETR